MIVVVALTAPQWMLAASKDKSIRAQVVKLAEPEEVEEAEEEIVEPAGPTPDFSVIFSERSVSFSGKLSSEAMTHQLATAIRAVRPDLALINDGLVVDPEAQLPPTDELDAFLREMGISTVNGKFQLWPDQVLIGGLTDSRIAITVLQIRLQPILRGRTLVNEIEVVPESRLPLVDTSKATSSQSLNPEIRKTASQAFQMPGILPEKLYALTMMLGHFDRLEERATPSADDGEAPRAIPMLTETDLLDGFPTEQAEAAPEVLYDVIGTIRFARNGVLLQANQEAIIEQISQQLQATQRDLQPVILKAMKPDSGSSVFNDYLCERRLEEVQQLFMTRNVDLAGINARTEPGTSMDDGAVVVLLARPAVVEPVGPASAEEEGNAVPPPGMVTPDSGAAPSEAEPTPPRAGMRFFRMSTAQR